MTRRKQKKHDYADLLKYMHLLEDGRSIISIHKEYGIDHNQLWVLWQKYQELGPSSLKKTGHIKTDFALRRKIVLDIEEKRLSLRAVSLKYGASPRRICTWLKLYRQHGWAALESIKKRGRPPGMGRPRKKSKPLTEFERLRKENQELKTENALLKKVRALVEERNARLRAIGQEPSKN